MTRPARQGKLILVEGLPGSGKTTMAGFVQRWLDQQGIPHRLYCEGDPAHPADFESVAYFSSTEYAGWLRRHPGLEDLWARYGEAVEGGHLVYYGQLARTAEASATQALPAPLLAELAQRDVYELDDLATHRRLVLERWRAFVARALAGDEVYLFECCLLQNPLTVTLLKHNRPHPEARRYLQALVEIVRPLHPALIYLAQGDVRGALERVASERPPEWRAFVGAYTDRGAWAQATGQRGFEGFVAALEIRQSVERSFLARSGLPNLVLDVTGREWRAGQERVAGFLRGAWL